MSEKKEYTPINIIGIIGKGFTGSPKLVRVIVGILLTLIVILPFYAVSNLWEALVAVLCTIILLMLSCIKRKWGIWMCCIWAMLVIINGLTIPFIGSPFGGLLSNERMSQRREEKFHAGFVEAIYAMSIRDYDNALTSFEEIKNVVPEEYLLEYYLWYGGTAMYAGENELSIDLLNEAKIRVTEHDAQDREILHKMIPICELVDYINTINLDELRDMANQYQNTDEQLFNLLELFSLSVREDAQEYEGRIRELLIQYLDMQDTYEEFQFLKNDLMYIISDYLIDIYPEYALILLAQMFEEDKAFFYERFLYYYPKFNPANLGFLSIGYFQQLREIYEGGWFAFQKERGGELEKYMPAIENLGYYLGSDSFIAGMFEEQGKQWMVGDEFLDWELYNVIPLGKDRYFAIWLETEETLYGMDMASNAHFYTFYFIDNQVCFTPFMANEDEPPEYIIMNKLFLVEPTMQKDKLLVEYIAGSAEALYLAVLDVNDETYEIIKNLSVTYHTSDFAFNIASNSYSARFEINNGIDPNAKSKVGGKVTAEINFERNVAYPIISYPDPAVEFFVEQKNDALVLPLESLNQLNGREIKSDVLLEKIRDNSTPYYKNSLIQHYYRFLLGMANAKLSGITIVYDYGTEEEASFFYYVKRDGDEIQLLGIYQIIDDQLQSVY